MPLSPDQKRDVGERLLRGEDVEITTGPPAYDAGDGPVVIDPSELLKRLQQVDPVRFELVCTQLANEKLTRENADLRRRLEEHNG